VRAKGRCPLDSCDFFEKKSSKSFISPAGGMGAVEIFTAVLTGQPKGRAGRSGGCGRLSGQVLF